MKAIILTSQTGQGHVSAANAIREVLQRRKIHCEITDTLSFVGKQAAERIAGAFVNVAVKAPNVFGMMYQAADAVSSEKRKSPVYYANSLYADKLYDHLCKHRFDAVICPHLFPAEAFSYLKRERKLRMPGYFVSTDYAPIPFLEELNMDGIFIPHEDLKKTFIDQGIPENRLICTGIPVSAKFRTRLSKREARKRTGIPEDAVMFLVMTGGDGGGNAVALTKELLENTGSRARVVVLTGRNENLKDSLEERFATDERVMPVAFTETVEVYMDACDVLLSKPGGITSTEAAVKNVPLIHSTPIPGVETKNARFFSRHGMSVLAAGKDDAAENAVRLSRDPEAMKRICEAQRQYVNVRAAEDICEHIFPGKAGDQ